jgi:hypothetical protein
MISKTRMIRSEMQEIKKEMKKAEIVILNLQTEYNYLLFLALKNT